MDRKILFIEAEHFFVWYFFHTFFFAFFFETTVFAEKTTLFFFFPLLQAKTTQKICGDIFLKRKDNKGLRIQKCVLF